MVIIYMVPISTFLGFSFASLPPMSGGAALFFSALAEMARKFFQQVFLDPAKNFYVVIAMSAVVILAVAGTAFLVKKAYDRFCV